MPTTGRSDAAPTKARIRAICLALPEAVEKASHGEPTWFAGRGKVFATFDDHHHRAAHASVWLPLPLGAQEALVDEDPARFFRPPYVGTRGWVGVVLDDGPDWARVARLVREGYLHVANGRQRALVRAGAATPAAPPAPTRRMAGRRAVQASPRRQLLDLDGIGPAMLADLHRLGVREIGRAHV